MSITKFDIWTTAPGAPVNNLIKELQGYIVPTLEEETCGNIVKRITYESGYKAVEYNATAPQSNPQRSTINFGVNKNKGFIALEGPGAVYDEFGTGERGADDAHPLKGFYGLNPYNSGPIVSTHINRNGRHYWFAPNWSSDPYMYPNGYTEGIPSGKQMYKTLLYIRSIKDDIIKEEVNNAIRTLK